MNSHIRVKALSRGPRQTRDTYGHFDGDPQRKTLCGAMPTDRDMSWAETRHPNAAGLKYVGCAECIEARLVKLSDEPPSRHRAGGVEYSSPRTTKERLPA